MHDVHSVLLCLKTGKSFSVNLCRILFLSIFRTYAVGGRDGSTSLRETEFFYPHTDRWSECASMLKCRSSVAVISCNNFLYAIGGYELLTTSKSIIRHDDGERYDPISDQWTLITSFSRPKESLGITTVDSKLYIIGGFDGKYSNDMEEYDTETDQWKKVKCRCYCSMTDRI